MTALGAMKDPQSVQPLIALLGQGMTEKGRISTILALGQMRHPDAAGVLDDPSRVGTRRRSRQGARCRAAGRDMDRLGLAHSKEDVRAAAADARRAIAERLKGQQR